MAISQSTVNSPITVGYIDILGFGIVLSVQCLTATQPPTVACKMEAQRNMYTFHTRFCTFGVDLRAQSVLINKNFCIEAQSLSVGYNYYHFCFILLFFLDLTSPLPFLQCPFPSTTKSEGLISMSGGGAPSWSASSIAEKEEEEVADMMALFWRRKRHVWNAIILLGGTCFFFIAGLMGGMVCDRAFEKHLAYEIVAYKF